MQMWHMPTDGSHADDGIYVLLKEVLDNALDEHMMGFGKQIVVEISSEKLYQKILMEFLSFLFN